MLWLLQTISRFSVWIAGGLLLVSAVLVSCEVLLRNMFQYSFSGADEISSYIFAIGVAWSLAFTLLSRAHIRIDLVYARLRPVWRGLLDVLALVCLLAVSMLLFQQAWETTRTSIQFASRSNTPLGIPLWAPQSLWTAGLGFFVLVQIALLIMVIHLMIGRNPRRVAPIAGVKSMDEEVEDEIKA